MSKHLRFKTLLGGLAILLTLGMSWSSASAQNTSDEKMVLSFAVAGQVGASTIDNTAKTIGVTVPYGSASTLQVTSFSVSPFAQAYEGQATALQMQNGTATPFVAGSSFNFASAMTTPSSYYITVEAENHSFVYYLVTINKQAPSTDASLLTVQLDYTKYYVLCGVKQTTAKTATTPWAGGAAVAFTTEANPNLDAVTLYFSLATGATATLNGVAVTSGTAHDFDSNNDGVAEAQTLVVTAQNTTTTATYTITVASALASVADDLLSFTYDPATTGQPAAFTQLVSKTMNTTTNVIDVVVNYMGATPNFAALIPTFTMSTYATAINNGSSATWVGGPVAAQAAEVCSGVTAFGGATVQLDVYAEDRTEVSTWTINITQATARTGNTLLSMNADYTATWGCSVTGTYGPIAATISGSTVTFNVAQGVTSVTIDSYTVSDGATLSPITGSLTTGSTLTVTSEAGVAKTYTVAVVQGGASSGNDLLTFGFKALDNTGTGIVTDVAGTITGNGGLVTVVVPWNTDLYNLVPYFTASDYSTVYIAESDGSYTMQCSRVTDNDYSNSLTYVVQAQNGEEERWDVSVVKEAVKTGNALTNFMLSGVEMCIGPDMTYGSSFVEVDGTDITVTVAHGTVLTNLSYAFTISDGATSSIATSGSRSFASPVEVTVTAQNGVAVTYTITVVVRNTDMNSVAKIKEYWFDKTDNSGFAEDVPGVINETAKTIHLWVPWGTDVTDLVASFVLENEPFVRIARSEDLRNGTEKLQTSGVDENDYTTPIAYTVYAEDCSTVEYFVTVYITPNTDTGISAFTFLTTGCTCEALVDGKLTSTLVSQIDPFAKRIHITVPYETDITDLAPYMITIHPEAKIVLDDGSKDGKPWNTKVDWTKGYVKYIVTAPDGVTKTTWSVLVENPPCQETDILSFSLPQIQVSTSDLNRWYKGNGASNPSARVVTYDYTNHTINVIIKSGSKLDKVYYERTLSCGAEICCVTGNCVDNHYLDFSNDLCHTCVVTAQDESITQEWTICLEVIDTKCPEVMTESVLAMNCSDSVGVTTNELGEVFIIHEDALGCMDDYYACNCSPSNPLGNKTTLTNLVGEKMLARATADTTGAPVYVHTDGLYSGVYYAFAIDQWGNVSCQSKQKIFIDICEKEVATLADLKAADPAYLYTVTGEVIVTYEETRTGGNLKYVQDETAGVEINDLYAGCSVTYGIGAGLTNMKGMIYNSNHLLNGNNPCSKEDACSIVFVPICCYSPTVSSKGNVVAPILLTMDEFIAAPRAYDAMFIRITTPMMFTSDGTFTYGGPSRVDIDNEMEDARGEGDWIFGHAFNTNYIGESFPDVPRIYQGINTYNIWSYDHKCYGTITPRWIAINKGDDSDILEVGNCLLAADPTPVKIDGVIPGNCSALTDVDIINEGANGVTITALYLDDLSGQDEFELIYPTPVPFALDHWGNKDGHDYIETVQVQFCPKDPGAEEATLIVEFCDGTILEVPIMGTTVSIFDTPYCSTFNKEDAGSTIGWVSTNMIYGAQGYNFMVGNTKEGYYYGWSWVTPNSARPIILESPGFMIEDLQSPVVKWWTGTYFTANLRVDVSNDYKKTWTTVKDLGNFTNGNAVGKWFEADLSKFEGTTGPIFIRWYSTSANYFSVDNVCVDQKITTPVYAGSATALDLGGVQLGESASATYTITNVGVSALKINSISYSGSSVFTLTDENMYPFEIHDGTYAYTLDPSGDALTVTVTFTPEEVGPQTGMLTIHYGMYTDHVVTVPISGEGLSCYTAAEAVLGENWAASQNSWFTFTPETFMIAYVTSCDPRNTTDPYEYSYDSYLQIYSDCEGTLIAENDDLEWDACPSNRASSGLLLPLNAGETIKIFWPWMFTSAHDADGFYFHIEASYPIDGDVCETAIPLTLPVVNHFGTTVGFEDDYDMSPCSPYSNYMDGNDKVYMINLETDGYLTGNILGAYGSIHVLDMCPKEELEKNNCKAFVGGPNGGEFTKRIAAGEYYVIISTWAPPQTVDYLLNMSFEEGSAVNDNGLTSSLTVYPNPTDGRFTVSISNAEAKDLTVELVNISGQVVYRNQVKAVYTYNEDIDASSFAKGVYYLKVNDGTDVKVEKVVIQ